MEIAIAAVTLIIAGLVSVSYNVEQEAGETLLCIGVCAYTMSENVEPGPNALKEIIVEVKRK